MRFGNKAQHRGHNNIGMADAFAEPIVGGPAGAVSLKDSENGRNLRAGSG